jgi:hypothetical protein
MHDSSCISEIIQQAQMTELPVPSKSAEELGAGTESRDSTLDASASGQPLTE